MAHAAAGACRRVVAVEPIVAVVAVEAVGAIVAVDPGVSEARRSADDRGRRPC